MSDEDLSKLSDEKLLSRLLSERHDKYHFELWCPRCTKDVKVFSTGGVEPSDLKDQDCPGCGLERVKRVDSEEGCEDGFHSGWPEEYDNVVDFMWEMQMKFEDEWFDEHWE